MKLYPPILEGTIPAFCDSTLIVPFTMNKSVSQSEVKGFALKIKNVQNITNTASIMNLTSKNWDINKNEVIFENIDTSILEVGSFYKIQMAYIYLDGTIGYYSTVGVVKYISNPNVFIEVESENTYRGYYSQQLSGDEAIRDYSEKVYSYVFTLKDSNGNIIETSGEKLHNSSNDSSLYESYDEYVLTTDLEKGKTYSLNYTIKTINGFTKTAKTEKVFKSGSIDSTLHTDLICYLDRENGYINIDLVKPEDVEIEEPAVGSFYLLRASSEDNYNSWHEVFKFVLYGQQPARHLWKDMTVKQGVSYKYAIQQFNTNKIRSNRIESKIIENGNRIFKPVAVDFEHAYLYDGERQLKIKYNPKVSSFKNTLLESKIDTIGSKHPFFFRNGNVNYKEFPISGLISYLSDENNLFFVSDVRFDTPQREQKVGYKLVDITKKEYQNQYKFLYFLKDKEYIRVTDWFETEEEALNGYNYYFKYYVKKVTFDNLIDPNKDCFVSTDLTSNNICLERNFKLEVLEWLTNGKPKLFRSPTEGNYIVRLMNVSLSPSDQLGRIIHTFNCTAYEIAENTYSNLEKYNFVDVNTENSPQLRWTSIDLAQHKVEVNKNLLKYPAAAVSLEGMLPGDKFEVSTIEDGKAKTYSIVIGATGRYIISLNNNVTITNLIFKGTIGNEPIMYQGLLTYAYYSTEYKDRFDTINKVENKQVACRQFIGAYDDIIKTIENVRDKIDSIGFIRFYLRDDSIAVYKYKDKYYLDSQLNDLNDNVNLTDLSDIYKVYPEYTDKNGKKIWDESKAYWYDVWSGNKLDENDKSHTQIIFNNNEEAPVDIRDTYLYELKHPTNIISLKIGAAIICEICYTKKVISYDLETTNSNVADKKKDYILAEKGLKDKFEKSGTNNNALWTAQIACKEAYEEYTNALEAAIIEAERR